MKLTNLSVRRPVFTSMVVLIVLILGIVSLSRLPIDLMPEIDYPTLTVRTSYENASPEEMEELITRPIEEAVAAVPGVEEITSVSAEGNSSVRVMFTWGTNLDAATSDIRDRLDRVIPRLPDEADRPRLSRFDPAAFPIVILGAGGQIDPVDLRQLMDDVVKQRLERVPGVAVVDVWGGLEREIHVDLDPDRVIALGLPLDSLLQTIRESNITVPAGTIERGYHEVTVRVPGQFTDLDELRDLVVANRDGSLIRLGEIAHVEDSHRRITRIVRINGEPGVRLAVRKQSGTNTVEVARSVLAEVERVNADVPQVNLISIVDTSEYIRRAIDNVARVIVYGGALAILVLLFFLRNIRSTLVIATAIPISIIATFTLIYFSGFTVNLMTLGGLALGVGMMVDSAIVVLENIARRREKGEEGVDAAIRGAEQVTPAILAGTITTLVIFLPMLFVEGMAGIMFSQLAYVVGFALICSLLVALTLIPMLSARVLRPPGESGPAPLRGLARWGGRAFERIEDGYQSFLRTALAQRWAVMGVVAMLLGGSLFLLPYVGAEFMPEADEGEVRVNVEMDVGTRLEVLDEVMRRIEPIVLEAVPEARAWVTDLGVSAWRPGAGATGRLRVSLVPLSERNRTDQQIASELRGLLQGIPGTEIRTRAGQGLFVLRMATPDAEQLQLEILGHELEVLDALGVRIEEVIENVPGVTDVQLSSRGGAPQDMFRIDRARAADLGLTVGQITRSLQTALAGSRAGEFRQEGDEHRILVKMRDSERLEIDQILNLTVSNGQGEAVALRNVIAVDEERGPTHIDRKNQQRIVAITANTSDRDLASIVADVRERLRSIPVPRNYEVVIAGDYEEQQEAFRELLIALVLALLLVYMVMACLYESLRDPLVVMFSVPLALIGVVVMLLLTETHFSVPAFIGCIMLGGIVVNNAILIVDQTTRLRRDDGLGTHDAVLEAGRRRLRPVLMTSLSTMCGLLPLALGIGEGAEAQAPMARTVIGGLLSATLITLVIIPIVYGFFHPERRRA